MNQDSDDIMRKYQRKANGVFAKYGIGNSNNFFLGRNSITGRPINLTEDEFKKHWHILGATGKGKTKFIEHIARTLIDNKQGMCLIDPHGDLYEAMVKYTVRKRLEHRVILLDPNRDDSLFGINYFERGEHIVKDVDAHVSMVMRAIAKVFGGEDQDTLPRLQHWLRNTIFPLLDQGYTMVEMLDFLSLTDNAPRQKILENLADPYIQKEWQEFEAIRKQEKEIRIESVLNRIAKFVGSERVRRIVGQADSTVNFREAMDEGKIVLVNLSPLYVSREVQKMLGIMIVDLIVEAAFSRISIPESQRKPFYFIVDEFGEFVCDDFAFALESLRKYGVFLMLSNQQMDQLEHDSSRVHASVMTNCTNKVTFGISRKDAEVMAKELFTGMIRGDRIKDVIAQTKFWPIKTRETVRGHAKAESHSIADSIGEASGSATSAGHTAGSGQVDVFGPGGPTIFMDALSHSMSSMSSDISMSSRSSVSSKSSSEGWGNAESWSEADVPWYDYQPFKEISSKAYFSVEEILEKFISWVKNQGVRQGQIKIDIKRPVPMVTPQVEDIRVRPIDVERFEKELVSLYGKPIKVIDEEIKERRQKLLSGEGEGSEPEEPDDYRE